MTILTLYVVNFECDFHYFHKSHTPKGSHYIVSTDNVATYWKLLKYWWFLLLICTFLLEGSPSRLPTLISIINHAWITVIFVFVLGNDTHHNCISPKLSVSKRGRQKRGGVPFLEAIRKWSDLSHDQPYAWVQWQSDSNHNSQNMDNFLSFSMLILKMDNS
jgi:hypothetical protein